MKIISFYDNQKVLIKKAVSGNRNAQRILYEKHAPKMLSVCRQYIKDLHFAEDVMIGGFVKVFKNLNQYRNDGSFEGWMRRIMIHEAISYLRKNQFVVFDTEVYEHISNDEFVFDSSLNVEYIQSLIDALPEGYRMVFVLYAIEGYKHHEIAALLNISESTSRTQLYKAKKQLQEKISVLE
ncbi:MAG: RNA polymerase sigma factor, partial [Muriicola sp.]|nr:RNA polymerase sigma factor [Muriicola sp.]